MAGLYFEDFQAGMAFDHPWGRSVTESDKVTFSLMTMNPSPLHIDFEFAAKSEWGQPLVNSMFTLALLVGMTINDTTYGTAIANLGLDKIVFPHPVFHGDTIRARSVILSTRASRTRPEAGIVVSEHHARNQRGEAVARCERTALMHRRPTQSADLPAG